MCFPFRVCAPQKTRNMLMSLVTLVITFFLSEVYALWRGVYNLARDIQTALSDISLVLASRAERDPKTDEYTPRASEALEDVAQLIQLYHALLWASLTEKFAVLLTPNGLSRMLSRNVMTRRQYERLSDCLLRQEKKRDSVGPEQVTMQWIYVRAIRGMKDGAFPKSNTLDSALTKKMFELNGAMGGIAAWLDGKIPLAYGQFVQLLVDAFLVLAPFSLYPTLGLWSVPAVGLLNLFYGGMLDLSKLLLFPLGNNVDPFYKDDAVNMDIGVLIRETNADSKRWKRGLKASLPF